jgi:hypothetical protein
MNVVVKVMGIGLERLRQTDRERKQNLKTTNRNLE